jgi:hypothetical protein
MASQPSASSAKDTARLLEILDVAYHEIADVSMDHLPVVIATIVGKLRVFESTLVAIRSAPMASDTSLVQQQQQDQIHNSLSILLHLSVLYSSSNAESNNVSGQKSLTKPSTILSVVGTGTISTPTNMTDENDQAASQHSAVSIASRDLLVVLCSILPRLRNMSQTHTASSGHLIAQVASDHSSSPTTTTTQALMQDLSLLGGNPAVDSKIKDEGSSFSDDALNRNGPNNNAEESLLDVARFLTDSLPEALLTSVSRLLPATARADPRIRTLLGPDADGNLHGTSSTASGFANFMLAVPVTAAAGNIPSGASGNSISTIFGGNSNTNAGTWSPLSSSSAAQFFLPTSSQPQTASPQQQQQQIALHQLQMQQRQQMAQQQQAMQKTLSPAAKARQSAVSAGTGGAGANTGSLQHQQQLFQQQQRNGNHLQSPSKSNGNNSNNLPNLSLPRPDLYSMASNNNTPSSPSTGLPPSSASSSSAATTTMTGPGGCRYLPFNFKTWENIPPVHVGGAGGNETETSLGLGLFAARRV